MTRSKAKNIVGCKFGRLTVLSMFSEGRDTKVICVCECGNQKKSTYSNVFSGNTKSCGCWLREYGRIRGTGNSTHGGSNSKEYKTWVSIKRRCSLKTHKDYKYWGGRGIKVCQRWEYSFENFIADMGKMPPGTSIDRINNDGDYEPGNCRWATQSTQSKNRRQFFNKKLRVLKVDDVVAMRDKKETGVSWSVLANTYGVSKSTARSVVARNTYKDIP